MEHVIGRITSKNDCSVQWSVKWHRLQNMTKLGDCKARSTNFYFSTGLCHFSIERKIQKKNNFTCILKLLHHCPIIPSNQVIQLSIGGRSICSESEWFVGEEPTLEIEASNLNMKSNDMLDITASVQSLTDNDSAADAAESLDAELPENAELPALDKVGEIGTQQEPRFKSTLNFNQTAVSKLVGDLKNLLLSGKNSDVVLKVEGKEFKAHRLILEMRTPVFSAMFEHEMEEKRRGVVNIEDCDQESFPDFLHYIYTGTVEEFSSRNVCRLYVAADKYQLLELKEECLEYMKSNVSVETFCDFMMISLRHHEEELTRIATEFFLENACYIVTTVKWMKFLEQNVIVGNELIIKLAENMKKQENSCG